MKIMLLGHARHGKDTACEMLAEIYGLTFQSSSLVLAEEVVRPWLEVKGISYPSLEACYADRVNRRADWFNALSEYNTPDLTRLGRIIYDRYDIYAGIRNRAEYCALLEAGLIDVTFWITRSYFADYEKASSMQMLRSDADYIIDNNGDLEHLRTSIKIAMARAKRRFYV